MFSAEREAVNAAERAERKQQLREKVRSIFSWKNMPSVEYEIGNFIALGMIF